MSTNKPSSSYNYDGISAGTIVPIVVPSVVVFLFIMACALHFRKQQRIRRYQKANAVAPVMVPAYPGIAGGIQYIPMQGGGMAQPYPSYPNQYQGVPMPNSGRVSPVPQYLPYAPANPNYSPNGSPYQAPAAAFVPQAFNPTYPGVNQGQYAPSAPAYPSYPATASPNNPHSYPATASPNNPQVQMNPIIQYK